MSEFATDVLDNALRSIVKEALEPLAARLANIEAEQERTRATLDGALKDAPKTSHPHAGLWQVKDAAEYLKVDSKTIRRWIDNGVLGAVRIGGCVRIRPQDVFDIVGC